jgi:hypothetical protein
VGTGLSNRANSLMDQIMQKWTNTFLVGIYKCKMTYSREGGLNAEWTPDLPDRQLSSQEASQYRAGRDALLQEVGKEIGGKVLVVET